MHSLALLKLMNLVSPALPVGAYAYSSGQEWAVDCGWLRTREQIEDWIRGVLTHSLGQLDIPCMARLYEAWRQHDHDGVRYWNAFVLANRETQELLLEDEQLGMALARLLDAFEITEHREVLGERMAFVVCWALAGLRWEIPQHALAMGLAWSWLENQSAAATKTVPLGQTQAQLLLNNLMADVPQVVEKALTLKDDELGVGLPALAIASSRHERQYSRLFRS